MYIFVITWIYSDMVSTGIEGVVMRSTHSTFEID